MSKSILGVSEPHRVCRRLQLLSSNCVSDDGLLVVCAILDHRIEHGQKFARASDDDKFSWFAGREEVLLEGLEPGIESAGGERGQIEAAPECAASAPDAALAAAMSGVIRMWGQSGESGDPASVEFAELREL